MRVVWVRGSVDGTIVSCFTSTHFPTDGTSTRAFPIA
jgi:hypothetical protein